MINAGLKVLGKIGIRQPELMINPCPKILSAAEQAAQAHRVRFGTQFEASIEAYITASTAPTDAHDRIGIVPKSIAEKHPNSLRLAAGICAGVALPVTDVADLLQAVHRKAIIARYGDPELGAGSRNVVLNVLKQVASYKGDQAAFDELVRQTTSMGKTSQSLPERTLLALAPFHNLQRRISRRRRAEPAASGPSRCQRW